jgi:DNA polymerase III subunit delta
MAVEKILADWNKKQYDPIYWLEGEEDYFIDKVIQFAEHKILSENEAEFNLSVFYGKDAAWADVVNACRRYPMFAERQVVLLKEAQQMRDIDKLESYIENPLKSTIFVVSYKEKKLDGRTKFAKLVKEKGVLVTTKKLYENQIADWTMQLMQSKGLTITNKALSLIVDHIGNDLSRINNEIEKLSINLADRKAVNEDDVEKYIGVSKEFNVFELQAAMAKKDMAKAIRIISYFDANPKAAPLQMILPALYSFFSKVYMIHGLRDKDDRSVATALGIRDFQTKELINTVRLYSHGQVETVLLLLHQYNLKSVGVNSTGTETASLLKELVVKMMA